MTIYALIFLLSFATTINGDHGEQAKQAFLTIPLGNASFHVTNPSYCFLWGNRVQMRDDYTYTPGAGAHKLHTRAVTWNRARKTCEEEGGHLAIINSIAESRAIARLFENASIVGSPHPDFASIGFHDLYQEDEFVTIHGEPLAKTGFTQWPAGQPDNSGGNENCGSVYRNGQLNDISCGIALGLICELPYP